MKLVIAYLQPFVADRVLAALHAVPGVSGATLMEARGFGRGDTGDRPTTESILGVSPRLRIEVAIEDDLQEAVVTAIASAAQTGHRGDGKVLVVPVTSETRIGVNGTADRIHEGRRD